MEPQSYITVQSLDKKSYIVSGNTVGEIRTRLSEKLDVNPEEIRLIRAGKQLTDDSTTLNDLDARLDTCWHCIIRQPEPTREELIAQKREEIERLKREIAELEPPRTEKCYYCNREVTLFTTEWVDGNPCDATYAEVCYDCKRKC